MTQGINVSHWNNDIDWAKVVNSGKKFAFVKATEGEAFQDTMFKENFQNMKNNNIEAGAYHVFRMNSTPDDQVKNITNTLKQAGFDPNKDKLAISATTGICSKGGRTKDCDDPTKYTNQERVEGFSALLTKLVEKGYQPVVHTSPITWNDYYTQKGHDFSEYSLWVANWTKEKGPKIPQDWKDAGKSYDYWNYTCKGKVEGIKGDVCMDQTDHQQDMWVV